MNRIFVHNMSISVLILSMICFGGEKKIPKSKLPAAVLQTFQQHFPTAVIKNQTVETTDGKSIYEIESIDSSRSRDVTFQADGTIVEVEQSLSENEIPQQVRDSLHAKYPNGTVQRVESSARGSHVEYEIALKNGSKRFTVIVNSAGKIFKVK